jgi:hypothetical protein
MDRWVCVRYVIMEWNGNGKIGATVLYLTAAPSPHFRVCLPEAFPISTHRN